MFWNDLGRRVVRWSVPAAAVLLCVAGSAQAASLAGSFGGNAYATFADVAAGPLKAGLGRSANITCPCQGTGGKPLSNNIASLTVGSVLSVGAATSTALTTKTSGTAEVTDSTQITGISLLGGLISADALTAVANVKATASTILASSSGTSFVNLKVSGQSVDANVGPNTVLTVPGIGTVTLNKVSVSKSTTRATIKVDLLSVKVSLANSLGLPVGTTLTVGHAESTFDRTQPAAVVGGQAYGASANAVVGGTLQAKLGQPALLTIPCLGTKGTVLTNNVNDVSVTGILSLGAVTTTAFGGDQGSTRFARTTAEVAGVNLLGGLIGASAITSVAQESVTGSVRTRSTAGTSFASLKILGLVLPINVTPNTVITLPALGKVTVNEQIVPATGGKTVVNGLHIVISTANLLGLPVGTEILVAHADAFAFPFPG